MAKGKSKSPTAADAVSRKTITDEIASVPISDDWNVNIQILVENKIIDAEHIKALANSIRVPLRRRFSILTYEELIQKVNEFGDPKNRKAVKPPPNSEICETIFTCRQRGDGVSLAMWARLIKFGILNIKANAIKGQDGKQPAGDGGKEKKPGKSSSDGKGKADKKGKGGGRKQSDTSGKNSDKDWSTLKKRGEFDDMAQYIDDEPSDGPDHYILISGFRYSEMLPLLEDIGIFPSGVIRMESESYEELELITSRPKPTIMQMQQAQLTDEEKQQLEHEKEVEGRKLEIYWRLLPHVFKRANQSASRKLQNVALHHFVVPTDILPSDWHNYNKMMAFGAKMFELLANMIYEKVDNQRQYRNFIKNLHLHQLPSYCDQSVQSHMVAAAVPKKQSISPDQMRDVSASPLPNAPTGQQKKKDSIAQPGTNTIEHEPTQEVSPRPCGDMDMRYYNDLMDHIPMESVSVPIMLHCMMEQVVATEEGKLPPSEVAKLPRPDQLDHQIADHIVGALECISLTAEEEQALADDFPKMKEKLICRQEKEKNKKLKESSQAPVIIRHRDQVLSRTHHLTTCPDIRPLEIERDMMLRTMAARLVSSCESSRDGSTNERSARLHELLRHQTSLGEEEGGHVVVTSHLMDRGFRQFVLESMPLSQVDQQGNIQNVSNDLREADNFWDDPYDLIIREAGKAIHNYDVINHDMIDDLLVENHLTREDAHVMRHRLMDKSSAGNKEGKSGGSGKTSRGSHEEDGGDSAAAILYQAINTHNQLLSPRRFFDDFVYSEQLSNQVLLQVLEEARHEYPCMNTYYHKRDKSLLVVFHHPISDQLDAKNKWFCSLYSDVGFRNYLDHISSGIEEWNVEQDAIYEKQRHEEELKKALEKARKEMRPPSPPKDSKSSKKSGKASSKKSAKNDTGSKDEKKDGDSIEEPENPFLIPGSIKYDEENKTKVTVEVVTKGGKKDRRKSSGGGKSGKKTGANSVKEDKNPRKKSKDNGQRSSKSSRANSPNSHPRKNSRSRKSSVNRRSRSPSEEKLTKAPSLTHQLSAADQNKKLPFSGYNVGNQLIQISGEETFLYPADGGVVSTQRFQYENGCNYIRVKVSKDGHVFTSHVLEPTNHEQDGQLERLLSPSISKCSAAPQDSNEVSNERSRANSTSTVYSGDIQHPAQEEEFYSQFGSTCAVFNDQMVVSYSLHGETGHCEAASALREKISLMLARVEASSKMSSTTPIDDVGAGQPCVGGKASPTSKGGKSSGKKSPRSRSPKQPTRSKSPKVPKLSRADSKPIENTADMPNNQDDMDDAAANTTSTVIPDPSSNKRNLPPQLFVSCPDGLSLCYDYLPTRANDKSKENCDDHPQLNPFIRQHYPIKKSAAAANKKSLSLDDELSRLIMNDGTVIKIMADGSTKILCLDGTVHSTPVSSATVAAATTTDVINTPRDNRTRHQQEENVTSSTPPTTPKKGTGSAGNKTRKLSGRTTQETSDRRSLDKVETDMNLSACWQTTRVTGEVNITKDNGSLLPVPSAKRVCYTARDPVTNEVLLSLEDRVVRVTKPDGGITTDHEDGTRITRFSVINNDGKNIWYVRVECAGFATVTFDQDTKESFTIFGSGSTLSVTTDGSYKLYHCSGGNLVLTNKGIAMYAPVALQTEDPTQQIPYAYTLRHNHDISFEMMDIEGNIFQVTNKGHAASYIPQDNAEDEEEESLSPSAHKKHDARQAYLNKYMRHPPRLFVINNDGSGSELLRHNELETYIRSAEEDPLTAVIRETLIGAKTGSLGLTIMKPHLNDIGDMWKLQMEVEGSIVPPNIRSRDLLHYDFRTPVDTEIKTKFGCNVGKGLDIGTMAPPRGNPQPPMCPQTLETRQLIQHPEISTNVRKTLRKKFLEYVRDLGLQEIHRQSLQVQDPRNNDEVLRANDLLTLVLEYDDGLRDCFNVNSTDDDQGTAVTRTTTASKKPVHEDHITTTTVYPEGGRDDGQAIRRQYEANLTINAPPSPRKARPTLTKEQWNIIRAQIMEEQHDRDALKLKQVPPYFKSSEGKRWLTKQARVLDRAAAEFVHDKPGRRGKPRSMSIQLADKDHPVCVGKRPIDKIRVTDQDELEQITLSGKTSSKNDSSSPQMSFARPNNPTPGLDLSDPPLLSDFSTPNHRRSVDSGRTIDSNRSTAYTGTDRSLGSLLENYIEKLEQESSGIANYKDFNVANWPPRQQQQQRRSSAVSYPDDGSEPTQAFLGGRRPQSRPIDSEDHILKDFYQQEKHSSPRRPRALNDQVYHCRQVEYESDDAAQVLGRVGQKKDLRSEVLTKSILKHNPKAQLNKKFIEVEEPVRRRVNNSSIAGPLDKGNVKVLRRGFELLPKEVALGILKEGEKYRYTVKLRNIGIDTCRYKVTPPPPQTGITLQYAPRMVAAGMEVPLTIDIFAIANGVDGKKVGMGRLSHQLEIVAETDILHLPISATVLTVHEYEQIYGEDFGEAGLSMQGARHITPPNKGDAV